MGRLMTLPAAAALICLALSGCGTDAGDDTAPPAEETSSAATTLELVVAGPPAAKCMVPNAEVLATQDTAFEGTVTGLADGTATLAVGRWFAGDSGADTVTVSTPSAELQELLVAVDFQEGRSYLVSSLDGRVTLCGFTAENDPELAALYEEAFAD